MGSRWAVWRSGRPGNKWAALQSSSLAASERKSDLAASGLGADADRRVHCSRSSRRQHEHGRLCWMEVADATSTRPASALYFSARARTSAAPQKKVQHPLSLAADNAVRTPDAASRARLVLHATGRLKRNYSHPRRVPRVLCSVGRLAGYGKGPSFESAAS